MCRRAWRTLRVWVFTFSELVIGNAHAACSARCPSTSTTHTRHTFTGVRLGA